MKYVNKHGLPDAFTRAVMNDPYSRGASDFSATSLQNPPRATVLLELFRDKIEIDVSSRVAATIGQGVHSILERAARPIFDIIETRFFTPVLVDDISYLISAQIDLFEKDTEVLYDWKTTKTFAFHKKAGPKKEWAEQLNVGRYILSKNGLAPRHLRIIGLLKDWDYKKALSEPGYPPTEVMAQNVKMWTDEETARHIEERIRLVVSARKELPKCSSVETWGGNRCSRWCDAAQVCDQWSRAKQTGLIEERGL